MAPQRKKEKHHRRKALRAKHAAPADFLAGGLHGSGCARTKLLFKSFGALLHEESARDDHHRKDAPKRHERVLNAFSGNERKGDRRENDGTEPIERRGESPRKSPVVGEELECRVDRRAVDEPEPETESEAVAQNECERRLCACSKKEAESDEEPARGDDPPGSEAIVHGAPENHRNGTDRVGKTEGRGETSCREGLSREDRKALGKGRRKDGPRVDRSGAEVDRAGDDEEDPAFLHEVHGGGSYEGGESEGGERGLKTGFALPGFGNRGFGAG